MTCPHSRDFLLAGRFDFIAGYLARGSISEGERRGSVLLAALLMLTRRLFPAGRARVAWGSGSGQICTVAPGGARSPLGELGRSGGAQSPPAERHQGELGRAVAPGGARSHCFVWVPAPGGLQRLSFIINSFSRFCSFTAPVSLFTRFCAQQTLLSLRNEAHKEEEEDATWTEKDL